MDYRRRRDYVNSVKHYQIRADNSPIPYIGLEISIQIGMIRGIGRIVPLDHRGCKEMKTVKDRIEKPVRKIVIKYKDGSEKELELAKATQIMTSKEMLNLERMKDGKWRLIWSEGLIKDFSQVERFEIRREG